jgi:hypothetical protein
MRGKDFNTGLRGVLFEARHYGRMGAAIWLYGWLVLRQTRQSGSVGWVLGGTPITYAEIEEETGFNPRTLERWMQTLRRGGYVDTESQPGGISVRILKAKKFPQGDRKSAERGPQTRGRSPQDCGAMPLQTLEYRRFDDKIGSSYVDGSTTDQDTQLFHRDLHRPLETIPKGQNTPVENSDPSNQSEGFGNSVRGYPRKQQDSPSNNPAPDLRFLRQLLRREREEAVRRELAVGSGPEVRRS